MSLVKKLAVLVPLLTLDAIVARSFGLKGSDVSQDASFHQFSVMAMLFGTMCVLLAEKLGPLHGPFGHSSCVNPTPPQVVEAFGWLLVSLPPILWLFVK